MQLGLKLRLDCDVVIHGDCALDMHFCVLKACLGHPSDDDGKDYGAAWREQAVRVFGAAMNDDEAGKKFADLVAAAAIDFPGFWNGVIREHADIECQLYDANPGMQNMDRVERMYRELSGQLPKRKRSAKSAKSNLTVNTLQPIGANV